MTRQDGGASTGLRADGGPERGRAEGLDARRDLGSERGRLGRLLQWLVLDADRRVVAGLLAVGIFLSLVALGAVDPSPLSATMTRTDPVETLFGAYVAAVVTGVTLVLSINQLVLSQELGAVGAQRERMDDAIQFRRDAEDVLDVAVSPSDPATFARRVLEVVARRAEDVGEAAGGETAGGEVAAGEAAGGEDTAALVEDVVASAAEARGRLAGARFGSFEVVGAMLAFDYSAMLHETRRLRAAAGRDDVAEAVEELTAAIELFGVTREHLKTLYFRWELVDLSRALLAAAGPALVVTSGVVLYLDAAALPGATLGVSNLVWTVSAASTVAALPFALLLSYVLRVATVAQRTLAIGPFELDDAGRPSDER